MQTNIKTKEVDGFSINLSKPLGRGSFGEVFIATHIKTQLKFAVKMIPMDLIKKHETLTKLLKREINIQMNVKNEHIVRLLHVSRTASNLYLFTDLCEEGDLESRMKNGPPFTEQEACEIIWQIADAFNAMGTIMHRDIKPANILLYKGKIKVADFGFAKVIDEEKKELKDYHSLLGTPLYMSPQILDEGAYTVKADVWSAGCLFYELLFGRLPWIGVSLRNLLFKIKSQPLIFPKKIDDKTKDLLTKMLKYDEENRISWKEVLEHPALKPQEFKEKK